MTTSTLAPIAPRIAEVSRNTAETQITVRVNLDGTGQAKLSREQKVACGCCRFNLRTKATWWPRLSLVSGCGRKARSVDDSLGAESLAIVFPDNY